MPPAKVTSQLLHSIALQWPFLTDALAVTLLHTVVFGVLKPPDDMPMQSNDYLRQFGRKSSDSTAPRDSWQPEIHVK